jgi:hypothetical protein
MEHSFSVELASQYGVEGAILVRHLQTWIILNKAKGKDLHEGHTWTYGTAEEYARIFPYFSVKQIRRILANLAKQKVIRVSRFNKFPWDRTLWYAFENEREMLQGVCAKGVRRYLKRKKTTPGPET